MLTKLVVLLLCILSCNAMNTNDCMDVDYALHHNSKFIFLNVSGAGAILCLKQTIGISKFSKFNSIKPTISIFDGHGYEYYFKYHCKYANYTLEYNEKYAKINLFNTENYHDVNMIICLKNDAGYSLLKKRNRSTTESENRRNDMIIFTVFIGIMLCFTSCAINIKKE